MGFAKMRITKRKSAVVADFSKHTSSIAMAINGEWGVIMGINRKNNRIEIRSFNETFSLKYDFNEIAQTLQIKELGKSIVLTIDISKQFGYAFGIDTGITQFDNYEDFKSHIDSMLIISKMEKKFFNHFERVQDINFCIREIGLDLQKQSYDSALISLLLRSDFDEIDFKSNLSFAELLTQKIEALDIGKQAKRDANCQALMELLHLHAR